MRTVHTFWITLFLAAAFVTGSARATEAMATLRDVDGITRLMFERLKKNISAGELVKTLPDGRVLHPEKGSIIAAPPSAGGPDYVFHWIRDSALVQQTLVDLALTTTDQDLRQEIFGIGMDFARFTANLQKTETAPGLGEVRFNVDGTVDQIRWARPQYDGPALRATWAIRFLAAFPKEISPSDKRLVEAIAMKDLRFTIGVIDQNCFDLWEYAFGDHYYTRATQLGAVKLAQTRPGPWQKLGLAEAEQTLSAGLERHWRANRRQYSLHYGPLLNDTGESIGAPGDGLDTAIVMAAAHSGLSTPRFSALDDRLWSTAAAAEKNFRDTFPINHHGRHGTGVMVGRHIGDGYFGGNSFPFLTTGYADLYYNLAEKLDLLGAELTIGDLNRDFLARAWVYTGRPALRLGQVLNLDTALKADLRRALIRRGDDFLRAVLFYVPQDGLMGEQQDKVTGEARSAMDLTWSYSCVISSIAARKRALAVRVK